MPDLNILLNAGVIHHDLTIQNTLAAMIAGEGKSIKEINKVLKQIQNSPSSRFYFQVAI
jgi:hypothetical protein